MIKKLKCILLIDDNVADNKFHQIVIEKLQLAESVVTVTNGSDALEFLNQKNSILPELILLDINMPRMDGWEFLDKYHHINANDRNKIVVVFLTTSINPIDMAKAEENPDARGFYSKPLNEFILKEIMERHFYHLKNNFD